MSDASAFDPTLVATVTVTFNPDLPLLKAQLDVLPAASLKILVDNASDSEAAQALEALAAQTPNARLLRNEANLGLAAALNRGVFALRAMAPEVCLVLLLDQDSEPAPGSIARLVDGFYALHAAGEPVGCVGPNLLDVATGLLHGFHQCTRWRWTRVYPAADARAPVPCAALNGSGTLVPVDLFLDMGGLDTRLFIDHVDTEWGFRLQARGYRLFGIPAAIFHHRMGAASRRFWLLGWCLWPERAPRRHYFLFRNAVILMGRAGIPTVWKVWAAAKLCLTLCVVLATGPLRRAQLKAMVAGVRHGLAGGGDPDA